MKLQYDDPNSVNYESKKSSGLMSSYEFADWLKSVKYHVGNRVVIEPRPGGLIEVSQYDKEGNEI